MKLRTVALRNITRNRRRSLLSATAIAVAAMAIVVLFSLFAGLKDDLTWNLQTYVTGEVRVRHREYDRHELLNPLHLRVRPADRVLALIEGLPEVESVSPRIAYPAAIYEKEETYGARVLGVDIAREEAYQRLSTYLVAGTPPEPGRNEAILGSELAKRLDVSTGDTITLLATTMRRSSNAITVEITGVMAVPVEALNATTVLLPIDRAARLARMDGLTEVLVKLRRGASPETTAAVLDRLMTDAGWEELEARSWTQIPSSYSFVTIAQTVYNFVALFFFILASSVIVNTTMMVIFERMREIGTLGAMGMTGGQIVRLFFLEALYLGLIGAAAGVALGIGLTAVLSTTGLDFGAAMEGVDFEIGKVIYPRLTLRSTVVVYVYAAAIAGAASLIPSARAARIRPVEALRG